MNYQKLRGNIRTGDVLVWTHRESPFSSFYNFKVWLVRLFQRSEYSHVGVAVVLGGRVFVLESVVGGIRLMPLSKLLPCYIIKYKNIDLNRAMSVCGEPYSQFEAIRGLVGKSDDTNHKWQCAEFVNWVHNLQCADTPSSVVSYLLSCGYTLQEAQRTPNEKV